MKLNFNTDLEIEVWVFVILLVGIILWGLVVFSTFIFTPHTFEGYYLANEWIWASYDWAPDERVQEYAPEMWQQIIQDNLHIKKKGD